MTETAPTQIPPKKNFIANKQPMSGVFPLMNLDCTICTAMFGNGAVIGGTKTISAPQLTEVPGTLAQIITEWCVAVRGAAMRSIVAVPLVAGIRRTRAARLSVFVWFCLSRSLGFSVLSFSLPPSHFYPLFPIKRSGG